MRDRVLVKRDAEKKMYGGVVLPETSTEKPAQGTVVDVGQGRMLDSGIWVPVTLTEGDRVLFAKYAGIDIEVDGADYVMLREDEILGVFRDEKKEETQQS